MSTNSTRQPLTRARVREAFQAARGENWPVEVEGWNFAVQAVRTGDYHGDHWLYRYSVLVNGVVVRSWPTIDEAVVGTIDVIYERDYEKGA